MKRESWIDSCRFWAIFVIMFTHYLATHLPSALSLWEGGPSWWLLGGLTGKFSVAFFFVLLGYFASAPRRFSLADYGQYCARRYVQFAFYVFVTTFLFILGSYAVTWLFHAPEEDVFRVLSDGPRYNLLYLLHDSFLFEDNYNATLWCMQQLFGASLICRALGCLPEEWKPGYRILISLGLMALLLLFNAEYGIWLCVGILGYLLRFGLSFYETHPKLSKPLPLLLIFFAAILCIKAPLEEGLPLYSLQGVGALLLLLVLFHAKRAQKLLAAGPFPWLGSISMGLFVVHTPINALLCSSLHVLLRARLPAVVLLPFGFCVSLALCILCAWLLAKLYGMIIRQISRSPSKV